MLAYFFDLDDTLVDTYGQLVQKAHQEAAAAMVKAGFPYSVAETYQIRLRIHQEFPRENLEDRLALEFKDEVNEAIKEASYQVYFGREVPEDITPFAEAIPLLTKLKKKEALLFLITSGIEATQAAKVQTLGLSSFFKEILYLPSSSSSSKQEGFAKLLKQYNLEPAEVICIGNRLDSEIQAGNRLGLKTIYLKHGEFAHLEPQDPSERPDLEILQFQELLDVLV